MIQNRYQLFQDEIADILDMSERPLLAREILVRLEPPYLSTSINQLIIAMKWMTKERYGARVRIIRGRPGKSNLYTSTLNL